MLTNFNARAMLYEPMKYILYISFPHRVAMLEFLEAAHSHLTTICQQCRRWIQSVAKATSGSGQAVGSGSISKRGEGDRARGEGDRTRFTDLLGELLMSVQRVMVRHRECTAITEENRGGVCYSCAV